MVANKVNRSCGRIELYCLVASMVRRTSLETVELNHDRTEQPTLTLYRGGGGGRGRGKGRDRWMEEPVDGETSGGGTLLQTLSGDLHPRVDRSISFPARLIDLVQCIHRMQSRVHTDTRTDGQIDLQDSANMSCRGQRMTHIALGCSR